MKIIKQGNKRRFECSVCGCVFEADPKEYRSILRFDECSRQYYYHYTVCPCCGQATYLLDYNKKL